MQHALQGLLFGVGFVVLVLMFFFVCPFFFLFFFFEGGGGRGLVGWLVSFSLPFFLSFCFTEPELCRVLRP